MDLLHSARWIWLDKTMKGMTMRTCAVLLLMLPLHLVPVAQARDPAAADPTRAKNADGVTITITKLEVNDTRLELSYEMRNTAEHEIWVCNDVVFENPCDAEIYFAATSRQVRALGCKGNTA
jgi:hypothetical protein